MTLRLGQALEQGLKRAISTSGIVALVLMLGYQVLFVGSLNTIISNRLPPSAQAGAASPVGFTLPLSTQVASAVAVVSLVFGIGISLVVMRLLTRDLGSLASLPGELFTRRIGRALLSGLVVSVVLGIAIPIGFVLLFVPGLFLTVSLQFALYAVAVEDAGPVEALRRSWGLATGNRWRLLALVILFGVLGGIGGVVGSLFSFVSPAIGQVASLVFNSLIMILIYGILADSFVQLGGDTASSSHSLA